MYPESKRERATQLVLHNKDSGRSRWSRRNLLLLVCGIALLAAGLGIGLGVGLRHHNSSSNDDSGSINNSTSGNFTTKPSNTTFSRLWSPQADAFWQIELSDPYSASNIIGNVSVYDIDLFNNTASIIHTLHAVGAKVVCYFSAGSYENWRPDASQFNNATDLGKPLDGWPGEWWLNTTSANVRNIMNTRLDMAVRKGCDAVDPDNVDAYDNDNGLGLTQDDAVNYVSFLSDAAHARNLSIGLKNAGAIIPRVLPQVEFSVNEQCLQYNECDQFQPFIQAGKPVFHIEYPGGVPKVKAGDVKKICGDASAKGFSTVMKEMDLGEAVEYCPAA